MLGNLVERRHESVFLLPALRLLDLVLGPSVARPSVAAIAMELRTNRNKGAN